MKYWMLDLFALSTSSSVYSYCKSLKNSKNLFCGNVEVWVNVCPSIILDLERSVFKSFYIRCSQDSIFNSFICISNISLDVILEERERDTCVGNFELKKLIKKWGNFFCRKRPVLPVSKCTRCKVCFFTFPAYN